MKKLFIILAMALIYTYTYAGIRLNNQSIIVGGDGGINLYYPTSSAISPSSVSKEGGTNATKEDGTDWLKEG